MADQLGWPPRHVDVVCSADYMVKLKSAQQKQVEDCTWLRSRKRKSGMVWSRTS